MSENLKEHVERMSECENQAQPQTWVVTVAPRHHWALCWDALQGAGGQVVKGGTKEEESD